MAKKKPIIFDDAYGTSKKPTTSGTKAPTPAKTPTVGNGDGRKPSNYLTGSGGYTSSGSSYSDAQKEGGNAGGYLPYPSFKPPASDNALKILDRLKKEAEEKEQTLQPTTKPTGSSFSSSGSSSYQSSIDDRIQKALAEAYKNTEAFLKDNRENMISYGTQEFLKQSNPYGVEAENLAAAGLASKGGYGQRLQTQRYGAKNDFISKAYSDFNRNLYDAKSAKTTQELAFLKDEIQRDYEREIYGSQEFDRNLEFAQGIFATGNDSVVISALKKKGVSDKDAKLILEILKSQETYI